MKAQAEVLAGVIREMVDEGYHFPNEWLVALAGVCLDLGGHDFMADWEGDREASAIDAEMDRRESIELREASTERTRGET